MSPRTGSVNQTVEQVNYFEEKCKELEDEIEHLRADLALTDADGALNKFIT